MAKRVLKILVIATATPIVAILAVVLLIFAYAEYLDFTIPSVCRHFSKADSYQSQEHSIAEEFSERIDQMYPVEISEDDLKKSLRKQGFKSPHNPNPELLPAKWMYVESNFFPCEQRWVVLWEPEGDGIAHDIHTQYSQTCM